MACIIKQMPSWKDYVDSMMATNKLNHAAILGFQDSKVYASSPGFLLSMHPASLEVGKDETKEFVVDEFDVLKGLINNEGIVKTPPGIWLNNQHFRLVEFRAEGTTANPRCTIYLKCKNGGATIVKTHKLIILAIWSNENDPNKNGGFCNSVVEGIAEEFIKADY